MLLNQYKFQNYFYQKLCTGVCLLAMMSLPATAKADVPAGFQEDVIAQGIVNPTRLVVAPDGRIFVAEQAGRIRIIANGQLLTQPFLNITSKVDSRGERGLLGIAFDPQFASNRWVYVYYTNNANPIRNRVSRFTANGNTVVAGSEKILMNMQALSGALNHNGGALMFGNDGKLYITVGDNAQASNAQTLNNVKGKVLRINKDGTIPTGNPFYQNTSGINRSIWARGLRNPFSIDIRKSTGRIHVNDVGQDMWEEVNQLTRGSNYGWPNFEGPENNPQFTPPIHAYPHDGASVTGCAIVGSAFYQPTTVQFPTEYIGDYFYGDLCAGFIRRLNAGNNQSQPFATNISGLVDIAVAPNGTLYYLERSGNVVAVTFGQ